MHGAAGEFIDKPAVDGAETELVLPVELFSFGVVSQDVVHFGRTEVGIDDQPGGAAHVFTEAPKLELFAHGSSAFVLPNDSRTKCFAGGSVPGNGGFALVGDAYCFYFRWVDTAFADNPVYSFTLRTPDFVGVVFNPALVWEVLCKLLL